MFATKENVFNSENAILNHFPVKIKFLFGSQCEISDVVKGKQKMHVIATVFNPLYS